MDIVNDRSKGVPVGPGSLDEKRQIIATIRSLDLRSLSIDEIKLHVWDLLDNFVIRTPDTVVGQNVHRARIFPTKTPPELLADIGLPPVCVITKDQRCNRAGQRMFYCTTGRAAALWENHAKPGDYFAVSKWRFIKPCRLNMVGYSEEAFWRLGASRAMPTDVTFPGETQANKEVRAFLADIFSVDVKEWRSEWYKLTTAITEILVAEGTFGGLLYPTIAMSARADNLALKPEFLSDGLKFVGAKYVVMKDSDGASINVDTIDFAPGVRPDGRLDWKGRAEQWILAKQWDALTFTSDENGERIARDQDGNIVDPQ